MNRIKKSLTEKRAVRPVSTRDVYYSKEEVDALSGGSGSSAWGGITGVLSDQTDLQTALDTKASLSSLSFTPVTITFPSAKGAFELETSVVASCSPTSVIEIQYAGTADTDENEAELLPPMNFYAKAGTGSFTLIAAANELVSGPVKLLYRII